jgi:hydrogenase maturation protein HypF
MSLQRKRLLVQGVVQGVGFRPFVYRIATGNQLGGSVRNRGDAGVEIHVEGSPPSVDAFLLELERDLPPLARITSVDTSEREPIGETEFFILPSTENGERSGVLPPDVAVCDACVAEILGASRFTGYWATSCTDCGPRFTVIESLPYDRPRTSMRDFPMCDACGSEYHDPFDRRYHAQTTACAACGPTLTFDGKPESGLDRAIEALRVGDVVAIKGIGGTHLACDATSDDAVARLRALIGRPSQPYALMAPEAMIPSFADPSDAEWAALRGAERPIVVLRERPGHLTEGVAPGLHTVGVMLPYSGLHHLLFARIDVPLVMTSANLPGRPMLIDNGEIERRLDGIADHLLLHERRIVARCDDSVRRQVAGRFVFLRRSRGWIPQPIIASLGDEPILALGPETDLTFAVYETGAATLSQHIGSVDDIETIDFLREAIAHLYRITRASEPRIVACDLHPQFATTRLADELAEGRGARVVRVQHHAAHLLSVMAEHGLEESVGIVLDGYGYGWDGEAWGGELFVAQDGAVERIGSLKPVRLPGGDAAARSPLRMAASLLHAAGLPEEKIALALKLRGMDEESVGFVFTQIERGVNAPWTTSAGRFLDAVAAWLGVCRERTYEGEPAMRLEAVAARGTALPVEARVQRDGNHYVVDTVGLFARLVDLAERNSIEDVAAAAQSALADGVARAATAIAAKRGIRDVCFSGGVAYNDAIASTIRDAVEAAGIRYRTNEQVPCGDGGISFGQAACAGLGIEILEADRTDTAPGDRSQ